MGRSGSEASSLPWPQWAVELEIIILKEDTIPSSTTVKYYPSLHQLAQNANAEILLFLNKLLFHGIKIYMIPILL